MKYYFFCLLFLCMAGFSKAQTQLSVGQIAPTFALTNIDGKTVSMSDYTSARGFIIIFTCNTCPYSQAYEKRIIELSNQYTPLGFPVIAINPNDPEASPGNSFDDMQQYAAKQGFTFPYLFDDEQKITRQYGARNTPQVFVVSKTATGNTVEYIGAIDNDTPAQRADRTRYVEDAVKALINNSKPAVTTTKAIGCRVRFKS